MLSWRWRICHWSWRMPHMLSGLSSLYLICLLRWICKRLPISFAKYLPFSIFLDVVTFSPSFQYYPSLNRSRCCMKSICTGTWDKFHDWFTLRILFRLIFLLLLLPECFLQMKVPNSTRPTQYPSPWWYALLVELKALLYNFHSCIS